eukprot:GHVU01057272.1.p2 GENE.GHVU01057272.1~~GHVU01057272.1.p2  ORF type:complete len:115 (+),score=4.17 GHVU01057272.1:150-494(+)
MDEGMLGGREGGTMRDNSWVIASRATHPTSRSDSGGGPRTFQPALLAQSRVSSGTRLDGRLPHIGGVPQHRSSPRCKTRLAFYPRWWGPVCRRKPQTGSLQPGVLRPNATRYEA